MLLAYALAPSKYRWVVLLAADYIFFWMISRGLIIWLLAATLITYMTGQLLARDSDTGNDSAGEALRRGRTLVRKKRLILGCGVLAVLGMLAVFKYFRVFGLTLLAPIGISYYTLQAVSYMTDVYRGTVRTERCLPKLALYLSFFPQIMEGPISRYHETAEALYAGKDISYGNLAFGYQRIIWGLCKKMLIADRLAPLVQKVFGDYESYDGAAVAVAVICYTIQLYMEFSGCMDIVIGSGEIFGIRIPENFRQPFFAKNASDFWHRWHITLGTWLKDYVFYPVSLAKPVKKLARKVKERFGIGVSKFAAPTVSLFCVWLINGIWHGAGWTYIFYGMYYFVLIFLENILAAPTQRLTKRLRINTACTGYKLLCAVKLFVIVNIGELFFRAETVGQGFGMLGRIIGDFHVSALLETNFGVDVCDLLLAAICIMLVAVVDVLHEKGVSIRQRVASFKLPLRWSFWYAVILLVVVFGAYGAGYTVVDMIYAAY